MRELTLDILRKFIDDEAAVQYPNDCRPRDMPVGRKGEALLDECFQSAELKKHKNHEVDPSFDWHGLLVVDDKNGDEYTLDVSFTMPLIITSHKIDKEGEFGTLDELTTETIELVDKIAEKYGYYLVNRDDLVKMAKELGLEEKDINRKTGLYD